MSAGEDATEGNVLEYQHICCDAATAMLGTTASGANGLCTDTCVSNGNQGVQWWSLSFGNSRQESDSSCVSCLVPDRTNCSGGSDIRVSVDITRGNASSAGGCKLKKAARAFKLEVLLLVVRLTPP